MIGSTDIRNYARRIVKEFRPERVLLFGSYAYGKPTEDSDVDLLVIMNHDKPRNVDQAIAIQIKIAAPFPLDLLVKRPAEVAKRLSMNDTFLRSVVQDGQVLYGWSLRWVVGLSTYAVEFRYPGESATIDEAKEAVRIMKNARLALKTALSKKISSSNHGKSKQQW